MDIDKLADDVKIADLRRKLNEKIAIAERLEGDALEARRDAYAAADALDRACKELYKVQSQSFDYSSRE